MMRDYQIEETGILGKALLITSKKELVYYRKGNIYVYDTVKGKKSIKLPAKKWKRVCCKIRLLERLLHIDAKWAVQVGNGRVLLQFDHKTLLINVENSKIDIEKNPVRGNPLSVAVIKGNPGFSDCIIVGDYTKNQAREKVSLYSRDEGGGKWSRVYQFPAGTVRHIHGCVSDSYRQCIYIFTGDENEESGIWRAVNNFDRVEPLLVGTQQYRTCQMLIEKDALYYFTDAPSEQNYMYEIKNNAARKLQAINGTCIYGVQFDKEGIYSTTCETDAHAFNPFQYWFTNVPGKGICGRNVDVFAAGDNGKIHLLQHFEHDGLPLRLFQYGTVTFTNAVENSCYFTPMCVKGKDMHIYKIIKKDGR